LPWMRERSVSFSYRICAMSFSESFVVQFWEWMLTPSAP